MENDLRSIAEALFENMKDKNLTIIHQRKINKYKNKKDFLLFIC